jgi:pimeloyl-ACP methyl ester carboxylesterase
MWTLFRNEAAYLAEWIEFHRLMGVERFFLYDNESSDGAPEVLAPYVAEGIVVPHEWPGPGGASRFALHSLQRSTIEHCLAEHGDEARWLACIDVDEFLFSPQQRSLAEVLASYERWPAVAVNAAVFGTGGHLTRPPGLVLENYTKRLDTEAATRAGRRIKNIIDPAAVKRCDSVHRFEFKSGAAVDEHGYPVLAGNTKSLSIEKLRINHYFARSVEDLRNKHARRSTAAVRADAAAAPGDRLIARLDVADSAAPVPAIADLEAIVRELSAGVRDDSLAGHAAGVRAALARRQSANGSAMQRYAPAMAPLEPLVDARLGVGHDFTSASKTMLVAFAAMSPLKPPPFHLFEATTGLPVKRLFVRDPALIWFQHGLPGFGETIDEVAASLRAVIDQHDVERLVVIGSSAGGYAALAFGSLLEADLVLSFSPQTTLERTWLDEVGDHRWPGHFKNLAALGGPDPRWVDLRASLTRERRDRTVYEVHYPSPYEEDARHAERLVGLPGVKLIAYERAYHNFIQGLRNRGELRDIFSAAGLTG